MPAAARAEKPRGSTPPAARAEKPLPQAACVLEFGITDLGEARGKGVRRAAAGKHDKPWRKPAAEVKAEREKTNLILGKAGGVDLEAVRVVLAVQELLDARDDDALADVQAAATTLRQVATNARPAEEVAAARIALDAAVESAKLTGALAAHLGAVPSAVASKLQLLHEVMPRLWVGGWAALNDECGALKQRKVTHIVSVHSGDQRRLPAFIRGHHYVRCDDSEDAADTLAAAFEGIVAFIEAARAGGGSVFVHCGAGISRAPTAACAYIIWKLRLPAAGAIKLVRSVRACARPNTGFVAALKKWESKVLSVAPEEGRQLLQLEQPDDPPKEGVPSADAAPALPATVDAS